MLSANFKLKRTIAASRGFLATARLSCYISILVGSHYYHSENGYCYGSRNKLEQAVVRGITNSAPVLPRSQRPKTAISLHSQSLGGSTGLPEDYNQTK